jgi:hypothetical protein
MGNKSSTSDFSEYSEKSKKSILQRIWYIVSCTEKTCSKCGCPSSYYSGKQGEGTCRVHTDSIYGICMDCGVSTSTQGYGVKGFYGNCNHKW